VVGKSLVPQKVLRHFPLIPRLRRMYNTPMQTSLMTWHVSNRSGDGLVLQAANSMQWQFIDESGQTLHRSHVTYAWDLQQMASTHLLKNVPLGALGLWCF